VFVTLFLDIKHGLITVDESAKGSLSRVAVYPWEIVRRADIERGEPERRA
jgi:DNA repair protein RadC